MKTVSRDCLLPQQKTVVEFYLFAYLFCLFVWDKFSSQSAGSNWLCSHVSKALNFVPSWLYLQSAGITDIHHHAWFMELFLIVPRLCVLEASILTAESIPHPGHWKFYAILTRPSYLVVVLFQVYLFHSCFTTRWCRVSSITYCNAPPFLLPPQNGSWLTWWCGWREHPVALVRSWLSSYLNLGGRWCCQPAGHRSWSGWREGAWVSQFPTTAVLPRSENLEVGLSWAAHAAHLLFSASLVWYWGVSKHQFSSAGGF